MSIYLCHKCNGVLSGDAPLGARGCGCMSGYVRDWQVPTPAADVLPAQRKGHEERLALYLSQGRAETDELVRRARAALA